MNAFFKAIQVVMGIIAGIIIAGLVLTILPIIFVVILDLFF